MGQNIGESMIRGFGVWHSESPKREANTHKINPTKNLLSLHFIGTLERPVVSVASSGASAGRTVAIPGFEDCCLLSDGRKGFRRRRDFIRGVVFFVESCWCCGGGWGDEGLGSSGGL